MIDVYSVGDGDGCGGGGDRSGERLELVQGGLEPHPLRLVQRVVEISHPSPLSLKP